MAHRHMKYSFVLSTNEEKHKLPMYYVCIKASSRDMFTHIVAIVDEDITCRYNIKEEAVDKPI